MSSEYPTGDFLLDDDGSTQLTDDEFLSGPYAGPYQPKEQVLDLRQTADNIFAFIAANQVDAAEWAGAENYRPINNFYISAAGRLNTIFPALMLIEKETALDATGDLLNSACRLTFEYYLDGSDTDQLVRDASAAAYILESMLSNLPHGTFDAGVAPSIRHQPFQLSSLETFYDVLRGFTEDGSAFIQLVQMRTVYLIKAQSRLNA